MLAIKKLNLSMKKDLRPLIADFSFSLGPNNRKVALIGEEGNGKTTLLKAIYDPSLIEGYIESTGSITTKGEVMGYLPQQIDETRRSQSAADLLHGQIPWEEFDYSLYRSLLAQFSLSERIIDQNQRFEELSGGEKIKIQLLTEMMKRPTLLLLDEPTNDLDLDSIALMERFIEHLSIPILFSSHDERLLENCTDTVIHLERLVHKTKAAHTIASLNYQDYTEQRAAFIDHQTRLAKKEKEEYEKQMERYRQIRESVQAELRGVSRKEPSAAKNLKDKMRSVKSMGHRFEQKKEGLTQKPVTEDAIGLNFSADARTPRGKPVLHFERALLKAGDRVLSRSIELSVGGREKVCIIGANGSGKTTLIREIITEIKCSHLNYGYMPQDYEEELNDEQTPIQFLTNRHTKEEHTKIRTYLGSLRFTSEEMLRPIGSLSGGQKAKLFFAKMILAECKFLVLDEPTRNLSPLSGPEVREALQSFGGSILAVSHDRAFIEAVFDTVYRLDQQGLTLITFPL